MKRTTCIVMTAAMTAGCGDNAITTPRPGGDTIVPTAFVQGMPLLEGPPPLACAMRYTIGTDIYDCTSTLVGDDPAHQLMTCPDALAVQAEVGPKTVETWLDEQGRVTRTLSTYGFGQNGVQDITQEYDDVGLHIWTMADGSGRTLSRTEVTSRTTSGNPLTTKQDQQPFPQYPASAQLHSTYAYDSLDRLVGFVDRFSDNNVLLDESIAYDDAAHRRDRTLAWGTDPLHPTAYTGHAYELVDSLGRLIEAGNIPDSNNPARTHDYTYDEEGRLSRLIYLTEAGVLITVDNFYDCE